MTEAERDALDNRVFQIIKVAEPEVLSQREIKNWLVHIGVFVSEAVANSPVDRALQRLRKANRIRYNGPRRGWEVTPQELFRLARLVHEEKDQNRSD